ncbi:MAG: helix-turn-helix transcriptional regulator [Clostridia bacterium]|nr:helix-turn-helix transcriptional regulator [Clostridia bacterium]
MKNIGERISRLRAEHRMSQGDLAEELFVSRQAISKWETGASIPDLENIVRMSEIFCVTTDYLIKGIQTEVTSPIHQNKPEKLIHILKQSKILGFIVFIFGFVCAFSLYILSGIYESLSHKLWGTFLVEWMIVLAILGLLFMLIRDKKLCYLLCGWLIEISAFLFLPYDIRGIGLFCILVVVALILLVHTILYTIKRIIKKRR